MDRPRHSHQLTVNKIGKKVKKTPLHLPSLPNANTSKNRLRRSVIPQLNGPHLLPPPALATPPMPLSSLPLMGRADQFWSHIAPESPVSRPNGDQMQPTHHSPLIYSNKSLPSPRFSGGGILPTPASVPPQSSFGGDSGPPSGNKMQPSQKYHHSSRFNGSASSVPFLPSPRFNGRGILPTPPGVPSRTPTSFTSSSMAQGGILGPGKFPHETTGLVFPPSPSGENTN